MNTSLFLLTLLASLLTLSAHTVAQAQGDAVALREQLMQAITRGDLAGAVALFADDAVIDGPGVCTAAPCVGKAAVQKEIGRRITEKNQPKTLSHYASGNVLTTRIEVSSDMMRKAGAKRIIVWLVYEVKDGKIVAERGPLFERTDPQTARYAEWLRTQQPSR